MSSLFRILQQCLRRGIFLANASASLCRLQFACWSLLICGSLLQSLRIRWVRVLCLRILVVAIAKTEWIVLRLWVWCN